MIAHRWVFLGSAWSLSSLRTLHLGNRALDILYRSRCPLGLGIKNVEATCVPSALYPANLSFGRRLPLKFCAKAPPAEPGRKSGALPSRAVELPGSLASTSYVANLIITGVSSKLVPSLCRNIRRSFALTGCPAASGYGVVLFKHNVRRNIVHHTYRVDLSLELTGFSGSVFRVASCVLVRSAFLAKRNFEGQHRGSCFGG